MEEAEQCDRLVVMAAGSVRARGTAAGIIGDRKVTTVRSADLNGAFGVLDAQFPAQVHGTALRAAGTVEEVRRLLSGAGIDAVAEAAPANLEEAFVDIVAKAADRTVAGSEQSSGGVDRSAE
jgi:ABC-2 type transport system ATP-binding protein/ribosome-dependent ATPase